MSDSYRKAGPLPDDHNCEACDCYSADLGFHISESGLCLACGGCWDPACCQHDEECRFEERVVAA